ncbi:MAG: hypothetical protein LBI27_02290 [Clostridiales bacterium]|jgi:hypothetical protein|nr:hypothetical protein [Clostridiales bacterium]
MGKYTVYTNNSIVAEFFEQKNFAIEVKWISAPAIEVLSAAKTAAHLGAVILSNPMSGVKTSTPLFGPSGFERTPALSGGGRPKIRSINPYLSVLAGESRDTVDFDSVRNIDEALTLYKQNARLRFIAHSDDTIKAYQATDLEVLISTITALESAK